MKLWEIIDVMKCGNPNQIVAIDVDGTDENWIYGRVYDRETKACISDKINAYDKRLMDCEIGSIFAAIVNDDDMVEFARKKGVKVEKFKDCEISIGFSEDDVYNWEVLGLV